VSYPSHLKPFDEARAGEESVIYQCPPGDDFGWVTDVDHFLDHIDDPITVKRQQWQLICEEEVTIYPTTMLCTMCGGDETIVVDGFEIKCPRCKGDGGDPDAGKVKVVR
jgi:hypothetical protein